MTEHDTHNEASETLSGGETEFSGAVTFEHNSITSILAAEQRHSGFTLFIPR